MADRHVARRVAAAVVFLLAASPAAEAAPIQAIFSGTVISTEGTVDVGGFFGAPGGDLTGSSYTAKFIYDLDSLGPVISGSSQFGSYVTSNSVYWGEITMNGHTITIDGFATPGDVTSSLWDSQPGFMFGKEFSADLRDAETVGNATYFTQLSDLVLSDQIPLLSLTTPFSSDNANLALTGEAGTGGFHIATFGSASDYEEIFDFRASSLVVSPVTAQVPEPWTAALFGSGLAGLALLRRRKGARASAVAMIKLRRTRFCLVL